jgi:hypothetical protein
MREWRRLYSMLGAFIKINRSMCGERVFAVFATWILRTVEERVEKQKIFKSRQSEIL